MLICLSVCKVRNNLFYIKIFFYKYEKEKKLKNRKIQQNTSRHKKVF